jgi:subtilisin family serine protease
MNSQTSAGWFLDRIYSPYGDGQFNYTYDGTGVVMYMFGSGLRITHNEFAGRASCGFTVAKNCNDNTGSSTAFASLAAGKIHGAAKNITLKAVKVYGNNGKYRFTYAFRAAEYLLKEKRKNPTIPMIILSAIDFPDNWRNRRAKKMMNTLLKAGFVFVVPAGENRRNACARLPQNIQGSITVAPTNASDYLFQLSNYGTCIDLLAPGVNVTVAFNRNDTDYVNGSGSGTAAGLVAGVIAMYLQKYPTWNATQVAAALKQDAIKDAITLATTNFLPNLFLSTDSITNSASP